MTPDNVARSSLGARQEIVLWLAIAGILATAIGFSWNPTPLAQALAAIFIACALIHAAFAYGARCARSVRCVQCDCLCDGEPRLRHGLSLRLLSFRGRRAGYGWQVHDIREATVAILLMTMVFTALLAALNLIRQASAKS